MSVSFTEGQKKFLADLQEKRHLEECVAAREHQGCGVVTDEMVEAAAAAFEAAYDELSEARFTPEYIEAWKEHGDWEDTKRAVRAALEAAFMVKGPR